MKLYRVIDKFAQHREMLATAGIACGVLGFLMNTLFYIPAGIIGIGFALMFLFMIVGAGPQ